MSKDILYIYTECKIKNGMIHLKLFPFLFYLFLLVKTIN